MLTYACMDANKDRRFGLWGPLKRNGTATVTQRVTILLFIVFFCFVCRRTGIISISRIFKNGTNAKRRDAVQYYGESVVLFNVLVW